MQFKSQGTMLSMKEKVIQVVHKEDKIRQRSQKWGNKLGGEGYGRTGRLKESQNKGRRGRIQGRP